ncbi:MAG: cation-translocating P-type ATPase [Myxococcales bacterium]|nr:cation-translocating P-type ATPase [Myxococcales bacterium]
MSRDWHDTSIDEALQTLQSDADRGLTPKAVDASRARHGENALPSAPRPSAFWRFLAQLRDPLVGTLLVAACVAAAVAMLEPSDASWAVRFGDTMAIGLIVLLNALLGFWQERRAEAALDALASMVATQAHVIRDGVSKRVDARELVPGDVVELEPGDEVPADVRLLVARELAIDEAVLTGESVPVRKDAGARLDAGTPLADRANLAFLATKVARGHARALVVETGASTEVGRIGALLRSGEREPTPLERRLAQLGKLILGVCLAVSALLFAIGMLQGDREWTVLLLTAVSLAVAAIPEGLPAITTITLALGMQRMAQKGAIVRRLAAVETLGSATVVCTDKTGTLTQNAMTVRFVETADGSFEIEGEGYATEGRFLRSGTPLDTLGEPLRHLIEAGLYANHAHRGEEGGFVGDPTEIALLVLGAKADLDRDRLLAGRAIEHELPFDSDRKRMSVIPSAPPGEAPTAYIKGAPDALLPRCRFVRRDEGVVPLDDATRDSLLRRAEGHADGAFRTLALAEKPEPGDDPEEGMVLLGLVAMLDPPRPTAARAVAECRAAGIHVAMITGDHRATAVAIAKDLGFFEEGDLAMQGDELEALDDAALEARVSKVAVFARASAEQKLRIVRALQKRGEVAAMTGDGVNDAPALKKADIGIAMGKRGTQVAQEAAGMVLKDDAFSTIVAAIEEGRAIFENIRKFVRYLLSCNVSEVMVVGLAAMVGGTLPVLPLQILFLNLVTDVFPALALAMNEGHPGVMRRPPRDPREPLLTPAHWRRCIADGLLIAGAVLGAMLAAEHVLGLDGPAAVTVSFLTLALAQLAHVFTMRPRDARLRTDPVVGNPLVYAAIALCVVLLAIALWVPPIAAALHAPDPGAAGLALAVGASLAPFAVLELTRVVRPRAH